MDSSEADTPDAEPVTRKTTQARAGTTPHIVRYVLAISLFLVVVAMAMVLAPYLLQREAAPAASGPGATTTGTFQQPPTGRRT